METVAGSLTIPMRPCLLAVVAAVAVAAVATMQAVAAAAIVVVEAEEVVVAEEVGEGGAVAVAGNRARNDTATSQEVWIREQGQAR